MLCLLHIRLIFSLSAIPICLLLKRYAICVHHVPRSLRGGVIVDKHASPYSQLCFLLLLSDDTVSSDRRPALMSVHILSFVLTRTSPLCSNGISFLLLFILDPTVRLHCFAFYPITPSITWRSCSQQTFRFTPLHLPRHCPFISPHAHHTARQAQQIMSRGK